MMFWQKNPCPEGRSRAITRGPGARAYRLAGLLLAGAVLPCQATPQGSALLDLSFDQLADIRITSVSKNSERLAEAAASVFVITSDDLRRSGVASLPEALRLAPNLQVAQASAYGYTVSARGFNSSAANKLLVLIDGRSV
jgi:iron complex outermembrane receptor protein